MVWDFETDPDFQEKLEWADEFVREEVEPIDSLWGDSNYPPLDDSGVRRPGSRTSHRFGGAAPAKT